MSCCLASPLTNRKEQEFRSGYTGKTIFYFSTAACVNIERERVATTITDVATERKHVPGPRSGGRLKQDAKHTSAGGILLQYRLHSLFSETWLGAESNRRHVDFQSTALPTELPSQMRRCRSCAGAHYAKFWL